MVARREALATKAWLAANPPKIIEVSQDDGGFDLMSAGIGAAVPLTLILLEVAGTRVLRRRRESQVASHLGRRGLGLNPQRRRRIRSPMTTEPLPGVGTTIGSYRIDAELGQGGMGVVYRAEDLRLGRRVALKLLRASLADDRSYRERFLRESRLAASIEHSAIIPIYEAGETDGLLYIAMRFVDGVDLAELLRREGPLAPERAVALVGQLASALDAAHARGLIHRDVKPSNALIGTDGDGEHAYLVDFGITQDTTSQERLTATDQLVGTLDYLAPERIRGEPADGRADIYALGCVLFECLTGQVPFARPSEASAIYAHLEEQPPRASDLRPGLPAALDAVLARALAKDRADRWQTGADLRAAAQLALTSGAPARARLPLRARLAAAALAALAVAGGAALLLGGEDDTGLAAIDANMVGVIDADGGGIRAEYSVGRDPSAIAVGAGSVWVANRLDGTVSRVTRARPEVVPIPVGGEPTGTRVRRRLAVGRGRPGPQGLPARPGAEQGRGAIRGRQCRRRGRRRLGRGLGRLRGRRHRRADRPEERQGLEADRGPRAPVGAGGGCGSDLGRERGHGERHPAGPPIGDAAGHRSRSATGRAASRSAPTRSG